MRTVLGTTFLFLIIFLLVLLISTNFSEMPTQRMAALEQALRWSMLLLGGVVATASSVGLLMVAAAHGGFDRQVALVLPLLGGLLLVSAHWGLAIALGAIVTGWLLKDRFTPPR